MKALQFSRQITNRENHSLEKYLQEISKLDLITPDEEAELTKRIRKGDQLALEKLTKANLRFVVSVAKRYQNYGVPLSDLINEGNVGLIKAGQRFDESRGFRFVSYAIWWIRQSIMYAIVSHSRTIRLPFNQVNLLRRISKSYSKLQQEMEREPTPEEVAIALEIPTEEVQNTMNVFEKNISMDTPTPKINEGQNCFIDTLENSNAKTPDSGLMQDSLCNDIHYALFALNSRESDIITMYFGLDRGNAMTLEDIGAKMSLTRERVRQIKDKAIRRLRHASRCKILKLYLG